MSAYLATLTSVETYSLMAALLFHIGLLTWATPYVFGFPPGTKLTLRGARWFYYASTVVIAAAGVVQLWIMPPDIVLDGARYWSDYWDQQGVHVIFGFVVLGLGYVLEDASEEVLMRLGAKPSPKHFRFWRWFTTARGEKPANNSLIGSLFVRLDGGLS